MPISADRLNYINKNQYALKTMIYGSQIVVVCYGIGVLYKLGVLTYIIPKPIYNMLDKFVAKLKHRTKPPSMTHLKANTKHFLTKTYLLTGCWWISTALGTLLFFRFPFVPISLPVMTFIAPVIGLNLTHYFHNKMKIEGNANENIYTTISNSGIIKGTMCFVSSISLGYAFGPLNWIGYDVLGLFSVIIGGSITGLMLASYLCRGKVSFLVTAQLLSSSIACSTVPLFQHFDIPLGDINVMLCLQWVVSTVIGVFHTIPTMSRFDTLESDLSKRDSVVHCSHNEPMDMCAYLSSMKVFCLLIYLWFTIMKRMVVDLLRKMDKAPNTSRLNENTTIRDILKHNDELRDKYGIFADFVTGLSFCIIYIKFISRMQKNGNFTVLHWMRFLFIRISPLKYILY